MQQNSSKKNLLHVSHSDSDSDDSVEAEQPIWLSLTTKQHIVDNARLTPSKIRVPHSLNKSSELRICLITADPQRAVKDVVADPAFPPSLSSRITKIIGYSKLKARYHTFESRRQLLAEHDIFLADERIITRLIQTLGKTFYKGTTKRPIPIRIALQERADGKRQKAAPKKKVPGQERYAAVASPAVVAKEIETTLGAIPVSLKPGTNVAVRVGLASFTPNELAENIAAVVPAVIQKHVVKGWKNVKAIHIKSPTSAALPIWLADDMWVGDEILVDGDVAEKDHQALKASADNRNEKKRKQESTTKQDSESGVRKKARKAHGDAKVDEERSLAAARQGKLAHMKATTF